MPCVLGYEVAGARRRGRRPASAASRSATASWPARASAATPRRSWSARTTPSRCPDGLSASSRARRCRSNYATAWAALFGHGRPAAGRARAHPRGGRRRGHRGDAARQAPRRRGLGHRVARPSTTRSARIGVEHADRLHAAAGGSAACRRSTWSWTRSAARRFRRSYRLLRPGGRLVAYGASSVMSGEKRDRCAARVPAALRDGARLRPHRADERLEDGHRASTSCALWDDRGTLEPWIAPLRELLASGVDPAGGRRGRAVLARGRRAPHHRRAAQRRQGRAGPEADAWARLSARMSCRLALRLLLLPLRGE